VVRSCGSICFKVSSYLVISNQAVIRQKTVPIVFVESDGTEKEVMAEIGKNLLDVAHGNNVELEGR
jgi:hypothetical protein